jgi:hypothetical protein
MTAMECSGFLIRSGMTAGGRLVNAFTGMTAVECSGFLIRSGMTAGGRLVNAFAGMTAEGMFWIPDQVRNDSGRASG